MFSSIPPVTNISTNKIPDSMITAFQIIHSTVRNDSYRSAGEFRRQEMHCIFHYTVSGHGEVIYQGVPYQTNPGQGFFNIINEESSGYRYPQCASEPWEFVVICFDGGNLRQIVSELSEKQTVYTITDTGKLLKLIFWQIPQCHPSHPECIFQENIFNVNI